MFFYTFIFSLDAIKHSQCSRLGATSPPAKWAVIRAPPPPSLQQRMEGSRSVQQRRSGTEELVQLVSEKISGGGVGGVGGQLEPAVKRTLGSGGGWGGGYGAVEPASRGGEHTRESRLPRSAR